MGAFITECMKINFSGLEQTKVCILPIDSSSEGLQHIQKYLGFTGLESGIDSLLVVSETDDATI